MPIVAKKSGGNFIPCPEGAHAAVCVDVVDLGILEVTFGGKTKKQHKIRVVWQIAEVMSDNRPYVASRRYTLSLHEKATMRKDLESWRGRAFNQQELQGFDVEAVIGVPCMINVVQETKEGQTYSNVTAVMRLPKGLEAPIPRDYTRVAERPAAEPEGQQEPFAPVDDDMDVPF